MKIKNRQKIKIFIIANLLILLSLSIMLVSPLFINASAKEVSSSAECMALLEVETGRVLYEKNSHKKRPMASTTKILTAITVIENTQDLDEIKQIPDKAVGVEGSSIYLEKGETLSTMDLLYGLMLQSGNDCAEALAILTSGSLEKFADLMNQTAKKIGANESNFVTPHGLHADDHYTTAYDLALISAYALKNETFQQISATKKHTTTWKGRDYKRVIVNKNKLLSSYDGCDGVKTGFTKKAGRCYVSSATRDNMQVVCAVLNCGPMFQECTNLMTRAFDEYTMHRIAEKGQHLFDIPISLCKNETVKAGVAQDLYYPLNKEEIKCLTITISNVDTLTAPLKFGKEIGKIRIDISNNLLFYEKLIIIEDALSLDIFDRLKDLADKWNG